MDGVSGWRRLKSQELQPTFTMGVRSWSILKSDNTALSVNLCTRRRAASPPLNLGTPQARSWLTKIDGMQPLSSTSVRQPFAAVGPIRRSAARLRWPNGNCCSTTVFAQRLGCRRQRLDNSAPGDLNPGHCRVRRLAKFPSRRSCRRHPSRRHPDGSPHRTGTGL